MPVLFNYFWRNVNPIYLMPTKTWLLFFSTKFIIQESNTGICRLKSFVSFLTFSFWVSIIRNNRVSLLTEHGKLKWQFGFKTFDFYLMESQRCSHLEVFFKKIISTCLDYSLRKNPIWEKVVPTTPLFKSLSLMNSFQKTFQVLV